MSSSATTIVTSSVPADRQVIGLDIGGTKCAVSQLRDGRVEEVLRIPTGEFAVTFAALLDAIKKVRDGRPVDIGVSCGGPLDAAAGVILTPPNLAASWHNVAIVRVLAEATGGRACLMNDANACALAEWRFGAGRGTRNLVFLTAGTGLGAGLVLNGELYEGTTGDAGEIGHVRLRPDGPVGYGKAGSAEGLCSGGGIARYAELVLSKLATARPAWAAESGALTLKRIAEAASAGDAQARDILQQAGAHLGEVLALVVDLFNPERIVLGGFFPRCHALLEPALSDTLKREALPAPLARCEIRGAELGETIGSHGAVAAALQTFSNATTTPVSSASVPAYLVPLVTAYPDLVETAPDVDRAFQVMRDSFASRGKLLTCGNGGSASDADHIVGELVKGFLLKRRLPAEKRQRLETLFGADGKYLAERLQGGLPAIALSAHSALSTAFANDVAPELVFAQQVHVYGTAGDVLLGISTSGRSLNVLQALRVARSVGLRTIGLTGRDGGAMAPLCDVLIRVPFDRTPQIQERHLPIYHALCVALEAHFFGE